VPSRNNSTFLRHFHVDGDGDDDVIMVCTRDGSGYVVLVHGADCATRHRELYGDGDGVGSCVGRGVLRDVVWALSEVGADLGGLRTGYPR
jgi:uncharacterized Rossmann fold enzyme